MRIELISFSKIDLNRFITFCNKELGIYPNKILDNNNIKIDSIDSYLSILEEFNQKDSDPRKISDFIYEHITFSFIMILDKEIYLDLIEQISTKIYIIKCNQFNSKYENAIITTGTLKDWKDCVVNVNINTWSLYMWLIFHQFGLNKLFKEYKIENRKIEKR